jgi:predicted RNase H-like nuclease (RuvC/YqgF family)
MGGKELLIVGVDPGTTLGYAVIDFDGNIVKLHSEKNLDLNSLITHLINIGKPLVVASDKEYNPDFVNRLAVKVGARLLSPDYDLKVSEKREITREFKTGNQHEVDALASALFALGKLSALLKKINIFVEHYRKENIKSQLIEFVVGKSLSIREAVEIIEEPEKEETKIIKEVVEERKLSEKDFLVLYKKYKESQKDMELIRRQNVKLKEQIKSIKRDYEYVLRQISRARVDRKAQSLLNYKEQRINFFNRQVKKKGEEIKGMQNEITTLIYFLSNLANNILLKKLDNLGQQEFLKKRDFLNIGQGDVLLVKDADIISDKIIKEIKDKVGIIFYKKPVSPKVEARLPFVFVDANSVNIEENEHFGILNKEEFLRVKNKKDILSKIITDYRNERE